MPLVDQTPGALSMAFRRGDAFSTLLDFSFATTGYTFAAAIYSLVNGATVATPTLSVVSDANGQINCSMTGAATAALAAGSYGVRVEWTAPGNAKRTATDGTLEVYP